MAGTRRYATSRAPRPRATRSTSASCTDVRVQAVAAIRALLAATSHAFRDPADPSARLIPQMWTEALRDERVRGRARDGYATVLAVLARFAARLDDLPHGTSPTGAAHVWLALMQGYTLQRLMLGPAFDDAAFREAARAAFGRARAAQRDRSTHPPL